MIACLTSCANMSESLEPVLVDPPCIILRSSRRRAASSLHPPVCVILVLHECKCRQVIILNTIGYTQPWLVNLSENRNSATCYLSGTCADEFAEQAIIDCRHRQKRVI